MKDKNSNICKIFEFLHIVEHFKSTLRYTTLKSGRQESSAEHSWRLALMVFLLAEELELNVDVLRAIKIALVHDIAETISGDYDSYEVSIGKLSKAEKMRAEKEAMSQLRDSLPKDLGDEIYNLWQEYEDCQTEEARYIKALDKIETLTQFIETGYSIYNEAVDHIATYADKPVRSFPELSPVLKVIKDKLKAEYKRGKIEWKAEYEG